MTHKDDDRMDKFDADLDNVHYNEQYSLWKENKKMKIGTNPSGITEKIPLSKFGIGFLVLLILLLLLFARNRITEFQNRIDTLEKRVKRVEEKSIKVDAMDDGMMQFGEQSQTIKQLSDRLDRYETALTARMDKISKNFENLQTQIPRTETGKAKFLKTEKTSKRGAGNRYHIVKSGETLYNIGRRYGVSVKELRMINKLTGSSVIHPGQKLVINP